MNLESITPIKGSNKKASKRIGRGQGSGKGGTSTRGHKGAKSRSGYSKKIGFEGGQMPLQRRIPKFGFKNVNRVDYQVINLEKIQELITNKKIKDKLDIEKIYSLGLVKKNSLIKILGKGKILSPVKIAVHKISNKAQKEIESVGGEVNLISKNG
tara:strand:+ start:50 stop:514 length:465 start_codon:yes stop_codon:yes gene_type:complete